MYNLLVLLFIPVISYAQHESNVDMVGFPHLTRAQAMLTQRFDYTDKLKQEISPLLQDMDANRVPESLALLEIERCALLLLLKSEEKSRTEPLVTKRLRIYHDWLDDRHKPIAAKFMATTAGLGGAVITCLTAAVGVAAAPVILTVGGIATAAAAGAVYLTVAPDNEKNWAKSVPAYYPPSIKELITSDIAWLEAQKKTPEALEFLQVIKEKRLVLIPSDPVEKPAEPEGKVRLISVTQSD